MFSMTKQQAHRWIIALSVMAILALAGAAALLMWVGATHGLVPAA